MPERRSRSLLKDLLDTRGGALGRNTDGSSTGQWGGRARAHAGGCGAHAEVPLFVSDAGSQASQPRVRRKGRLGQQGGGEGVGWSPMGGTVGSTGVVE